MGTVVVGVPVNSTRKDRKQGRTPSCANAAKSKQAKHSKPAKAADASKCQQQEKGLSAGAPAPKKKKATKKRKVLCESPPRLPPISPGALSLQAGVKRRRLAKQLQEQATAEAASCSRQEQAQTERFCEQLDQLASKAATKAASPAPDMKQATKPGHKLESLAGARAAHINAHARFGSLEAERVNAEPACGQCTQHLAQQNSQALLQDKAQPSASQIPSHGASQEADETDGKQEGQVPPSPGSRALHASQASDSRSSHSAQLQSQTVEELQTLSFDVSAMELFQQQDTCDAFGSFWRRTSGVGVPGTESASQRHPAAPSAFGGQNSSICIAVCMPVLHDPQEYMKTACLC